MIDALPLLLGPEGYQISRSVRLRSSASAYLNRTPASAGNRQTWTWSGWVKRGTVSPRVTLFGFGTSAASGGSGGAVYFDSNTIYVVSGGGTATFLSTTPVYRDPSAWYHIVIAFDSTQATASNRIKIYVNGLQVTAFANTTYPSQNYNSDYNNTIAQYIGVRGDGGLDSYFDGYLTEINSIDGQALTPSSFGETNPVTGVWQPKKYTGTYGTNGFYLNFSDNSAATAAAIGKDYSGNGNNWTPNNISVTAGATYDSMLDVPTQWADGGNGRGNYATWNPIDHPTTFIAPTNGNLSQNCNTTAHTLSVTTFAIPDASGLWQWELVQTGTANGSNAIGVCLTTVQASVTGDPASRAGCSGVNNVGTTFINGATSGSITYPTVGNTITCLYDATNRTLQVFDNGVSRGTITGLPAGDVRPFVDASSSNGSPTFVANFGQRPFSYNQGGKALNTLNLPTPTILKGNQYFDATLWTGTGATLSVTNSGSMQPDLVWIKQRSAVRDHRLTDSVRGVNKQLFSNTTGAETSNTDELTAFNSNGFTLSTSAGVNASAGTYVGWQWKEGATQGFDIVTYTGNGANRTVAHSLGVAPAMVIVKNRTAGGAGYWLTWHKNMASASYYLALNLANAQTLDGTVWNSTAPTSSVFSLGTNTTGNNNGTDFIAYLFSEVAGFSRFGSYTGNGSADGPFVFCGFRPRWIMMKRTDATEEWIIYDSARDVYNPEQLYLYPNSSAAEAGSGTPRIDFVANGFKCRNSGQNNVSAGTYIYAAFSETSFKYALGR